MNKSDFFLILVAVVVFIVFVQVFSFDFLKYDDTINVSENFFIQNPSAEHLLNFWKGPFLGLYIPVTYTVWSGIAVISHNIFDGRQDAGLFHLLNLIIHVFNAILVFFIIRKLFDLKDESTNKDNIIYAAAFGALIFGLHPVQVETVSWITGLKGILSGFFSLWAIYLYLQYYSSKKGLFVYGVSTGLLILAMLSMPSAVAVPVILFFLMLWVDQRITGRAVYPLVLWVALALITVMLTRIAQPTEAGAAFYPWQIRPLVALDAVMFYVHKIFWPHVLTVDYGRTPAYVVGLSWRNPYLLLLLLFASVPAYRFRHRKQWLALGLAFVAGILPVSGLLPFAHQETSTVADRYLYLSMVVIAVASASIIIGKMRLPVISLCLLIVVMLGVRSFYQCGHWKNTESIMGLTLQYHPRSFRANLDYGISLMSRGDFHRAIPYYKTAQHLRPGDPLSYYNLGVAYAATGDEKLYEWQFQRLKLIDPEKASRLKYAASVFEKLSPVDMIKGPVSDGRNSPEE